MLDDVAEIFKDINLLKTWVRTIQFIVLEFSLSSSSRLHVLKKMSVARIRKFLQLLVSSSRQKLAYVCFSTGENVTASYRTKLAHPHAKFSFVFEISFVQQISCFA